MLAQMTPVEMTRQLQNAKHYAIRVKRGRAVLKHAKQLQNAKHYATYVKEKWGWSMALRELLDKNELQRLQDGLCMVAGISAYCLDHEGERITRLSGDDRYLHCLQEKLALDRVMGASLEDLAVEDLEGRKQVAALSIEARGEKELYWIVYRPEGMKEDVFYGTLELLRDASISFLQGKLMAYGAEARNLRDEADYRKMTRNAKMNQAMSRIVHLLDKGENIEDTLKEWLDAVCNYLALDTAQIFKVQEDEKYADVILEWRKAGENSYFERSTHVPAYAFLKKRRHLILNADSAMNPEFHEIFQIGVKAMMIFPAGPKEGGLMVALNHLQAHAFDEEEESFAAEAVKVLDSILIRRIQKNSLDGAYASMEAVLDGMNSNVMIRDEVRRKLVYVNQAFQRTFANEIRTEELAWLWKDAAPETEEVLAYYDHREVFHEEKERWYDLMATDVRWVDGNIYRMYSLYDVTAKKQYQGRIEQQACTDFMTGLYNRMRCERDLAEMIKDALEKEQTGALLYLDLDDFKHINDGLGHQYGDALLKAISHAFQRIPGIERTCYRMGGDEFVILVPPESYDRIEIILEDVQQIFSKPWFLKDSDYYCTMSMGAVTFPDNGDAVTDLVKKADMAMYAAKKAGKNRIQFYNDGNSSSDRRHLDMVKNMRDATAKNFGEFEVYYQPIMDVSGKEPKCSGAEALVRWNNSNLGFLSSTEFIPLAEYLGLINPIGNHVLREACRQCKEWNDKGFDYKVNVNLSVIQLLQSDIVEIVENALTETGFTPEHLTLEVTESLAINDMERMKKILGRIRDLGVKIALDDFGTGYSSLNYIHEIAFHVIKVDQSFIRDLVENEYSKSFIRLVNELARTIGATLCVEGVESLRQYKILKDLNVKYVQGFYFDKPMKAKDFEKRYCSRQEEETASGKQEKPKSDKIISIKRK